MAMLTRLGGRTSMLTAVLGLGLALAVPPSYAGDGDSTTCLGQTVTVAGTTGNDFLFASSGDDVVAVYGGDDVVLVASADPAGGVLVCGGAGSDQLLGNDGADVVSGGNGPDYLAGGAGADVLKGGPSNDLLDANAGERPTDNVSDVVDGGPGVDECIVNPTDKVKNCETVEVRG